MRAVSRLILPCACALVSLMTVGCASGPATPAPLFHSPYFVSRDGNLRYRLPAGWFDATAESTETNRIVLLVRNDYRGTLTMREVFVDAAARKDIVRMGLLQVGRLTAALEKGSRSGVVARDPETLKINGTDTCVYEVEFGDGDRVRTMLLDTGTRVYALTALISGGAPPAAARDIYAVQQAFVNTLRW